MSDELNPETVRALSLSLEELTRKTEASMILIDNRFIIPVVWYTREQILKEIGTPNEQSNVREGGRDQQAALSPAPQALQEPRGTSPR